MTMRIETYASDDWVLSFSLAREHAEGEHCRETSLELLNAMLSLCEKWIAPLAVNLRMESRDPDDDFSTVDAHPPIHGSWFLRQRMLDENLQPRATWSNPEVRVVESVDASTLSAFVEEALHQRAPLESLEVALSEVSVDAFAVSLPDGVDLEPLYNGTPARPVVVRTGSQSTVLGPKFAGVGATPLRLRAINYQYGTSSIKMELCWDFWTKHPAGIAQLRSAIERVSARGRGWQLERGAVP